MLVSVSKRIAQDWGNTTIRELILTGNCRLNGDGYVLCRL